MDWLALLLKLGHVAAAFALVVGLLGRWILLTRAAKSTDLEQQHMLAETASPFERAAQIGSRGRRRSRLAHRLGTGLSMARAHDAMDPPHRPDPVPMIIFVPAILIPRGRAFEAAMTDARAKGIITPALRAAWSDRAVAFARRYELVGTALIVALMVLQPF